MILTRFAYLPLGTLGRLNFPEGHVQIWTLERAWAGNMPYVSCIPDGTYELRAFSGARWKGVLEVVAVPNRSAILIHPANQPLELAGCIAPGLGYTIQNGTQPVVSQSREALTLVLDEFARGDTTLVVRSERAG